MPPSRPHCVAVAGTHSGAITTLPIGFRAMQHATRPGFSRRGGGPHAARRLLRSRLFTGAVFRTTRGKRFTPRCTQRLNARASSPVQSHEEVARLHLEKLGVKLTTLTQTQADYIGVPFEGPYKPDHYRY